MTGNCSASLQVLAVSGFCDDRKSALSVVLDWQLSIGHPGWRAPPSPLVIFSQFWSSISLSQLTYQPHSNFQQETAMFKVIEISSDSGCLIVTV